MSEHLYLHVPFCKSICFYCDFCHRIYDEKTVDLWIQEIEKEISTINISRLKTIYIGGGTPTSLNTKELERLLSLLDMFVSSVEEYTIEVNPETLDNKKADLLVKHGINRVSLGLQTFNEDLLKSLNRRHSKEDVIHCVQLLRNKGITNISCDLMYSLPAQTMDDFLDSLKALVELKIPHISFYSLTIEENSVFGKKGVEHLDEETEAEMYEQGRDYLLRNGYRQYEVSNYCLEGYESKHNLCYWHYDDFIGAGCGASGKENHVRYDNTRSIRDYIEGKNEKNIIELTKEDEMFENLMMSLRLEEGLNLKTFKEKYGTSFEEAFHDELEKAVKKNEVIIVNDHIRCRNREVLNNVLLDFMK